VASAGEIARVLQQSPTTVQGKALDEMDTHSCYEQLVRAYDDTWGGFGTAPKFPAPHNLTFLLRYWKRTGEQKALTIVEKTLHAMQQGGIQDHLGYGFHRYSTDRQWLVPHFEKMLYDQALLATAFVEAYQATRNERYATTARNILTYVLRDMTAPDGGFYTAEDADSEGEEGKFYLWTAGETRNLLGTEAAMIAEVFDIRDEGNFASETTGRPTGANILHLDRPFEEVASRIGVPLSELEGRVESARRALFEQRLKRVRPARDDKILADWNGLMAAALARAGRVLGVESYVEAAGRSLSFILNHMIDADGRLFHRFRDGEAAVAGNLDDYAFVVHGLLEMYEATFEASYLRQAVQLNRRMIDHFWDAEGGGFFSSADDAEKLISRYKDAYDGAIPSGNSVAMQNLLRLSMITGDVGLQDKASAMSRAFSETVRQSPSSHACFMSAVDLAMGRRTRLW